MKNKNQIATINKYVKQATPNFLWFKQDAVKVVFSSPKSRLVNMTKENFLEPGDELTIKAKLEIILSERGIPSAEIISDMMGMSEEIFSTSRPRARYHIDNQTLSFKGMKEHFDFGPLEIV